MPKAEASPTHKVFFVIGQKSYTTDGQVKSMEAATFTENSRTYVPVRYLAYALGIDDDGITWNPSTQTVTLSLEDTVLKMVVGNTKLYVNNQEQTMTAAPCDRQVEMNKFR